jgi:hypothetical protein
MQMVLDSGKIVRFEFHLLGHKKIILRNDYSRLNLIPLRNYCKREVEPLKLWWMVVVIKRLSTLWRRGKW